MTFAATALAWGAEIPPKQKLVLLFISDAGMAGQHVGPKGIARLARFAGISEIQARKAIGKLESAGWIEPYNIPEGEAPSVRVKLPGGAQE